MERRMPTPPFAANAHSATPRRVLDIAADTKLQSTPSNRGSATASEHLMSILVDDVSPSILADIRGHSTCPVKTLLNGLLSLCLPEEQRHNAPADLLDQCIKAVLPICNTQARLSTAKGKQKQAQEEAQEDGLELRKHLVEYCEAKSDEMAGYGPFVYAFNHALRALHNIDVPLRKSKDLRLLFHRNDPKFMTAVHNGHISQRKPDILLVFLDAARNAFSQGDPGSWDDHALKTAAESPRNGFQWSVSMATAEFKRTKSTLPLPPDKYTVGPTMEIPPKPVPSSMYETPDDLPTGDTVPLNRTVQVAVTTRRSERLASRSNPSRSAPSSTPLSHASSGRKRKSEHGEGSSTKKLKMEPVIPRKPTAMLQSALYAAERMSHAIWVSHAIGLVVIDDVAYVWWYDNEGAIQSHGVDFVQDLPHFLVLLLCFERFTPKDWGIIPDFKFTGQETDKCLLSFSPSPPLSAVDIVIDLTDKIRDHFGIVGRATQMLHATSQSVDPRDVDKSLKDTELVLKVYWPEASRVGEGEIIAKAHQIAQHNDKVNGHIPDLICSYDFDEYSTKQIRTAFGLGSKSHRLLRTMLHRRLYPITDLIGEKFWKAFWECFRCHYHLWVGGVEHNDISVKNLMYDKHNGDCGVLNDYDLSHLDGQLRPSGTERTGTMPFMALDLLTDEAWDGKVMRLYRHDCESFAWALLWICCRYEDGQEIDNPPLNGFITGDYNQCFEKKFAIQSKLPDLTPTSSYDIFWKVIVYLLDLFITHRHDRQRAILLGELSPLPEPTINEMVEKCQKVLEQSGFPVELP